ncbi:class I SAM-dependent methyltransferase, partial [Candidatus Parcubacteria bacterium]
MKKQAYQEMFQVENTHWWYRGLHDLVLHLLDKWFPGKSLKIFDAGCGTGQLISLLSDAGHQVSGLDYSDDAV